MPTKILCCAFLALAACSSGGTDDSNNNGDDDNNDNDSDSDSDSDDDTINTADEWTRVYGGGGTDWPADVLVAADGTIIVVGRTDSTDGDLQGQHVGTGLVSDVWVLVLEKDGTVRHSKTYGGTYLDYAVRAVFAGEHTVAVAATSFSSDGDLLEHHGTNLFSDIWLFKFDYVTGERIGNTVIGGDQDDAVTAMRNANSGTDILLVGSSASSNTGDFGLNNSGGGGSELLFDAWQSSVSVDLQFSGTIDLVGGTGSDAACGWVDDAMLVNTNSGKDHDLANVDVIGQTDQWIPDSAFPRRLGGTKADFVARTLGSYYAGSTSSTEYGASGELSDNCIWWGTFGGQAEMYASARCLDGDDSSEAATGLTIQGDTLVVVGKTKSSHTLDFANIDGNGGGVLIMEWTGGGKFQRLGNSQFDTLEAVAPADDQQYIVVVGRAGTNTGAFAGNHGHDDLWVSRIKIPAH